MRHQSRSERTVRETEKAVSACVPGDYVGDRPGHMELGILGFEPRLLDSESRRLLRAAEPVPR